MLLEVPSARSQGGQGLRDDHFSAMVQKFRCSLKVSDLVASLILIWLNIGNVLIFFNLMFFTASFIHINIDSSFIVYLGYLLYLVFFVLYVMLSILGKFLLIFEGCNPSLPP